MIKIIFLLLSLFNCSVTSKLMDESTFIDKDFATNSGIVGLDNQGRAIKKDVDDSVKKYFKHIVLISKTIQGMEKELKTNITMATIKEISVGLNGNQSGIKQIKGRKFFSITGGGQFDYIISIKGSAEYYDLLEFELMENNPQYSVAYNISPKTLIDWHQDNPQNRRVLLFASGLYAPDLFVIYKMGKSQVSSKIPLYLEGDASFLQSEKETYGKRLVLRSFKTPSSVKKIIDSPDLVMLKNISKSDFTNLNRTFSAKTKIFNPTNVKFLYNEKYYEINQDYALHLQDENVMIECDQSKIKCY